MAKRTIGKPRFYADILQYLKAKGYYGGTTSHPSSINPEKIWDMNPYQKTFIDNTLTNFIINNPSKQLDELMANLTGLTTSGIYCGVFNHGYVQPPEFDVEDIDYNNNPIGFLFSDSSGTVSPEFESIVNWGYWANGFGLPQYKGYSLANVTGFNAALDSISAFSFYPQNNEGDVGCVSYGRWFEPPHSFDVKSARVSTSYSGIDAATTPGGSTLTQTNYLKKSWGNLPAWTLEKQTGHDYNVGADRGMREWGVSLEYLSDEDVFSKAGNENKFFTWTDQETDTSGTPEYVFDESMASFFKLTLNGSLPFIFCPNSSGSDPDNEDGETDLEFAICRISKPPVFRQVSNGVFSTKLTITEVM